MATPHIAATEVVQRGAQPARTWTVEVRQLDDPHQVQFSGFRSGSGIG
jgi:hypothetical protein